MDERDKQISDLKKQIELLKKDRDKWVSFFNRAAAQRDELQQAHEALILGRVRSSMHGAH